MTTTATATPPADWTPSYSRWRHGGWYVDNVRYVTGAVGCVSRNFHDRKWRIVCHHLPFAQQPTFATRDQAAAAEYAYAASPEVVRRGLANLRAERQRYIDNGTDPAGPVIADYDKRIARALALLT